MEGKPRREAEKTGGFSEAGGRGAPGRGESWVAYSEDGDVYLEVTRRPDGSFEVSIPLKFHATSAHAPSILDLPGDVFERLRRGWLLGSACLGVSGVETLATEMWQVFAFSALFPGDIDIIAESVVIDEKETKFVWRVKALSHEARWPVGKEARRAALEELKEARRGRGDALVVAAMWLCAGDASEGRLVFNAGTRAVSLAGEEAAGLARRMLEALRGEGKAFYELLKALRVEKLERLEELAAKP
ncbi:hypothetical protein [Thermofilum pendens]